MKLMFKSSFAMKALMLVAAFALSACGSTEGAQKDLSKWYSDGMTKIHQQYGSVSDLPLAKSGLVGIFHTSNAEQEWPRVALTITAVSPRIFGDVSSIAGDGMLSMDNPYTKYACLTVSATVWESKNSSHKIAPIVACTDQMVRFDGTQLRRFGLYDSPLQRWATSFCNGPECSSSNVARLGPTFPHHTLPTGKKYQDIFMERSYFANTFDLLLQVMGFDLNSVDISNDHRIWIVDMPLAAPPGEPGKTNINIGFQPFK